MINDLMDSAMIRQREEISGADQSVERTERNGQRQPPQPERRHRPHRPALPEWADVSRRSVRLLQNTALTFLCLRKIQKKRYSGCISDILPQ